LIHRLAREGTKLLVVGSSMASTGTSVAFCDIAILKTKQKIEAEYETTKVTAYVTDVIDSMDLEHSLGLHAQTFGKLHVLVANAGFLPSNQSLVGASSEDWYNGFEINVKGNFNLVRAFLPHATKNAVVLSTSTAVAQIPYVPGMSSYAASKLAAAKVYEYLHHEQPDLFVLNFHPGTIKTTMSDKAVGSGGVIPYDHSKCILFMVSRLSLY
jgi:NAD(P)-dependent dehydrogenase (short-subunit alcohol dehydrogenase family)